MSLLYKRPNSPYWYVTRTRQSTRTGNKKLAEEFARKALTDAWRAEALGETRHTWDTLAADWLDVKEGRPSADQDRMVIDRFGALLRRHKVSDLSEITGDTIADYAREAKARGSASTANRHLTVIRAMLRRAHAKGWIRVLPTIEKYETTRTEVRWLTIDQFKNVLPHLPEWIADMATFAVQTGMRYSNVAGMRWDWLAADGAVCVVPAVSTKTGRTYTVPLSGLAQDVIARQRGRDPVYVFVGKKRVGHQFMGGKRYRQEGQFVDYTPVPMDAVKYHWRNACKKAGLPGVRWHDLRHTWASWHVQSGTPDRILAQMGGWSSTRMLDNYAHLATKHLEEYADNLNPK